MSENDAQLSARSTRWELHETRTTWLAGRRYYPQANVMPGEVVYLVREPANRHDRHAFGVLDQAGELAGHLPRELAAEFAGMVDEGIMYLAARLAAPGEPGFKAARVLTTPALYLSVYLDQDRLMEFLSQMGLHPEDPSRDQQPLAAE
jgi:hypothetical protein